MKNQSAEKILATTIERVRDLVDVSTIVGEPIQVSADITIIPISKVTYGFASGGSDFPSKNNVELFGGGGGAGITINPVAFLVCNKGEVTIKHITASDNAAERAVNLIPEMFDKVTNFVDRQKQAAASNAEPAVETIVETE
ncbi:MAG: sporulation protein YtfJ [Clostridia bacterium]|nr:sporulation protein YtfJ [Clostridia bacterium]